ncbi:MAG: chemotaxis-specific protein-glutamate methyltransferase CheB [Smithellaceae bacterium]|nr:chemotaxis-specific protein-glutamate methyltransferase CheB [Syntrophaceae bacterium]MDD4241462.1 chemotaxis-specific protein-glutamate methyltransferase CheB [Smithellaceae bacterium]NLX52725.1 chemotaxis-specific protein-glutamate methyltransferase CheB [Deltaproteobacteria bacterium]
MPFRIALAHHQEDALNVLRQILAPQTDYALAWIAQEGEEARRKCRLDGPDILLVDLALAGPDGARLVCDIMKETPCAILLLSDAIAKNAGKVFEAMGCGALDAITTPVLNKSGSVAGADALLKKLATISKLLGNASPAAPKAQPKTSRQTDRLPPLVAIGSSTGGPKALATILSALPGNLAAALVVCQHVDLQFAQGLAQWLDSQTPLTVTLAREGMRPRPGVVLVAGTNDHLVLGPDRTVHYTTHPREYPYRPSVNTFFQSLREHWPGRDLAVLLTGMGRDGAEGLASLRKAGWHTIVQDEKTSIVYGMPAAAAELGAAVEILPLDRIAGAILKKLPRSEGKKV